ncbi:Limb region 1 -like protein [Bulinus truncatus]|nr:Limb region 1 -like protein [Bulinus truncatus]
MPLCVSLDAEPTMRICEEDAAVYRIALWLCTGTLSVSVGAVLLLPISIISNEVLLLYPDSYYIKWLNSSLIQGLWNHVFFFSNLALFILMPFAYFFTEAEGFSGSTKGLMSRVKEASLVLFLLGILVMGLAYVASAIISGDESTKQTLSDVWHEHLPYLYSCISFIGVLVLLISRQRISFWRRNLCYPLVMLLLLAITVFSILIVLQNTFLLLVGTKALPRGASDAVLGISSLSSLGPFGAALQIVVILYLMAASVVGFYSLPYLCNLQPKRADTSMVKIIVNCVVILLLSSALPILSKTLGITNFDLVGNFGSMDWLGNFYIIFLYNISFAVSTALCLFTKFTSTVRREIYDRLYAAFQQGKKTSHISPGAGLNNIHMTGSKTETLKEE